MGKGKKKGDKKKDEPKKEEEVSLASLSLSETPSSSRETTAAPEDEGGLTGGGRKTKTKKPAVAPEVVAPTPTPEAAPTSAVVATTPEVVAPTQPVKPVPPEPEKAEAKDDDDGLGLGLGGAKKKRPRKKKEAPSEASGSAPASARPPGPPSAGPQGEPPARPPSGPTSGPPAGPPASTPQASIWGRGASQPTQPGALQPGFPGAPQPQFPGQRQPQSGPGIGRGQTAQQPQAPGRQPTQAGDALAKSVPVKTPSSAGAVTTVCNFKIPAKIIGNSVRARPIQVLTNYLPMKIKPLQIHRYDVSFQPDKPKKMIPRAFNEAKGKHFSQELIAFDQMKNCYTLKPLPKVSKTERFTIPVEITDNNNKVMKFEVSFKATGVVNLATILDYMKSGTSLNPPTEAIQCIDVILRQGTLESYIKAGRQFFKRPSRPIDLGDGLEMWTGLFQSAIFTSSPFINIDVAHKGFPKNQPMIDAMSRDFRLDLNKPLEQQRSRGVENFQLFIKGLRVIANIGGDSTAAGQRREFICNGLVAPPNVLKFDLTNQATGKSQTMTVADYFAKEKKVRLRYPNLNCMWVGPRDKKIYYPIELLEVSYGQALNKQLNEMQLSTMVREAATPPDQRKRKIEEVIKDMNYSKNVYFKQFGLEIDENFCPVQAKVLMPPKLDVGGGQTVDPRKGQWQANRLLKPEALQSWGFIALECDHNTSNAQQIIDLLKNIGSQMGMTVTEPKERFYNITIQELQNVLFKALKMEIKFLVIVVATRGRDYYHKVKQFAEREVGILTQCIKENTAARRMNPQTARNILLKVNSKLMGINQALDNRCLPKCLVGGGVMVVGADVTHPSPDQSSLPSIAAVTASIDQKCFVYNIQLSIQTPKKEMIVEFEDMMVEHLQVYKKHQKSLPKKIFVFRDGVSEGQFAQVMNSELTAVHRAYQRMTGTTAKPEVLFLLVQKRHHTRMFAGPTSPYNVEPGTVVDTHIVHARELDFYLVSHQAIKGTARPTRYHAVCNDGHIPHDEVEQLTYYLCHLYSRCMRAVSYPTPTYYAHLACLRARSLTFGQKFDNADLEKSPQRLRVLDKMLEFSRMFFV